MSGTKLYTGGCHCGKVRFEVEADISQVISCNCTICEKTGTILAFAHASKFKLLSGEDMLSDYQFNKKIVHHLFCRNCGVRSFARGTQPDGTETVAVNVRCLDGVDVASLAPQRFDGRSL